MSKEYTVCPKCGLRHSKLVRHRCAKPKGQKDADKVDASGSGEGDSGAGGGTEGGGGGQPSGDMGQGQGQGEAQGEGQGQGQAQGGEGEGQGEGGGQSKGQAEGQSEGKAKGEGEGEGEAPEPQAPEDEAPPVAVVVTVLKFAALTAQCAKHGDIEVTLSEDGLLITGQNDLATATDTLPWGEFEKRSTLDGEFYVKELIDGVDQQLAEKAPSAIEAAIGPKGTGNNPLVSLPLKDGQWVRLRNAKVGMVTTAPAVPTLANVMDAEGEALAVLWRKTGQQGTDGLDRDKDAVENAAQPKPKAKAKAKAKAALTLPLTVGQRVVTNEGAVGTVSIVSAADARVDYEGGGSWWHKVSDGRYQGSSEGDPSYHSHIKADAPKPKLTLPMYEGQKVKLRNGEVHKMANTYGDGAEKLESTHGWYHTVNGLYGRGESTWGQPNAYDAVEDA